jgi:malate synthase
MNSRTFFGGVVVCEPIAQLVDELSPDPASFWSSFELACKTLNPKHLDLLGVRDRLQAQIDAHHQATHRPADEPFLTSIGYLVPASDDPQEPVASIVKTTGVSMELLTAAPQLVVPGDNARFVTNAVNARWGSLFDCLFGTDAIDTNNNNNNNIDGSANRREAVFERAAVLLDLVAPLKGGSHRVVERYEVREGSAVVATLADGTVVGLADPVAFVCFSAGAAGALRIVFVHHGLHVEVVVDRESPVGRHHRAGVADVQLEAALTCIFDLEDSVAAVDGEDKAHVYRNWASLCRGDLAADVPKGEGKVIRRTLNPPRGPYTAAGSGKEVFLAARAEMLVRHVGLHMRADYVTCGGEPCFEGVLDAWVTALAVARAGRTRTMYAVKPKLHGPAEVRLACEILDLAEDAVGLPRHGIKLGVMDEERRTSCNLGPCLEAAADRVVFINTGFLDRTGDEIHTMMALGPVLDKQGIRQAPWLAAYEARNVAVGLSHGLRGRGQIGKGMFAMPAKMKLLLETKAAHPRAGATCAWVPSPTAATLHATHYHEVDVEAVQRSLLGTDLRAKSRELLPALLTPPVAPGPLPPAAVRAEVERCAHGILGYVARWVALGIGCSTVMDVDSVGQMEDRATLRISSQLLANWLLHGVTTEQAVDEALDKMAELVNRQQRDTPGFVPLARGTIEFKASRDLIFEGREQPNGLTEDILFKARRQVKATRK